MQHSKEWWLAATLSTSIPVIYSFSGGMRASIMTDATQLVICVGFFIALLAVLGSKMPTGWDWNPSGAQQPLLAIMHFTLVQHLWGLQSDWISVSWMSFNIAGTCALPASPQPLTYEMCAVDGGAQLVNNTLVNVGKAQFTYTNASCNYPSKSRGVTSRQCCSVSLGCLHTVRRASSWTLNSVYVSQ